MKLNFVAPKADTGYGVGARAYANNLGFNYKDTLEWYDLAKMPEDWKSRDLGDEKLLIFWHLGHLSNFLPKSVKNPIAISTFEVDDFTDEQKRDAEKFRAIGTCSKWGKDLIEDKLQVPSFILPHFSPDNRQSFYTDSYAEEVDNNPEVCEVGDILISIAQYIADPRLRKQGANFLSVGKYEVRKSQAELLKALTMIDTPCILFGIWFNPFLPGGMDFSDLHYLGFRESSRPFKHFRVFMYPKTKSCVIIPKKRLSAPCLKKLYNLADAFISVSKAEGFNIPLYDAVLYLPVLSTINTGQEFVNRDNWKGEITSGPLVPARDGKWFHGVGNWHSVDPKDIADKMIEFKNSMEQDDYHPRIRTDYSEYENIFSAVKAFN